MAIEKFVRANAPPSVNSGRPQLHAAIRRMEASGALVRNSRRRGTFMLGSRPLGSRPRVQRKRINAAAPFNNDSGSSPPALSTNGEDGVVGSVSRAAKAAKRQPEMQAAIATSQLQAPVLPVAAASNPFSASSSSFAPSLTTASSRPTASAPMAPAAASTTGAGAAVTVARSSLFHGQSLALSSGPQMQGSEVQIARSIAHGAGHLRGGVRSASSSEIIAPPSPPLPPPALLSLPLVVSALDLLSAHVNNNSRRSTADVFDVRSLLVLHPALQPLPDADHAAPPPGFSL